MLMMLLTITISVVFDFTHTKRIKERKQVFSGSDVYVAAGSMRTATQKCDGQAWKRVNMSLLCHVYNQFVTQL